MPEDRCFWNKKYKGYHGKWICNKMEMAYIPRHKFAADMGGTPARVMLNEGVGRQLMAVL